ncbi:MAG: NADH-quinone oxidoreductase subunit L [Roseococcus sp.]|nr:NADH-quinone oxidoreductase subunit L [Roseococcus sp.]
MLPWLLALAPLALLSLAAAPDGCADRFARLMRGAALLAAGLGLLVAALAAGHLALLGGHSGFWIRYDAVSGVMLLLIGFIGLVVTAYSRRYLDGDPGQGRFAKWLALTLGAVTTLVLAGNILLFALAWLGVSLALDRLLLFYGARPGAQLAWRKKFVATRAADAALLLALALLGWQFGSLEIGAILAGAKAMAAEGAAPASVHLAAFALAVAAVLKSAQFPVHGWLPEVMETPTPVSALLHAGIINAGGFLLVRMAEVVALSAATLDALVVVGAVTAVFGAAVMLTQTSVKVALAWSTVAQMGFMVLQCGLGAFSAALLHIVAHGLYKAHAFLTSGGVAQTRRHETDAPLTLPALLAALAAGLGLTALVALAFDMPVWTHPGVAVLGAALMLGLAPMLASALLAPGAGRFVALRVSAIALAVCIAYFGLQAGAQALLGPVLPAQAPARGPFALLLSALTVAAFAALLVLNLLRRAPDPHPAIRALYVHLHNGLYVNALANRVFLRLWPIAAAK